MLVSTRLVPEFVNAAVTRNTDALSIDLERKGGWTGERDKHQIGDTGCDCELKSVAHLGATKYGITNAQPIR